MLEKIGLPPKPSLRGSNWVVDASHCQGCSSQFTFLNRKSVVLCTQQRMVLRGQGDSPVRICDPCKKLEEAARFEMRYGHKSRAGKGGSSKIAPKHEDTLLNEILGIDGKRLFSSARQSHTDVVSDLQRATSSASCSNLQEEALSRDVEVDAFRAISHENETGSNHPEELRQQALEEKKKYRVLKGEGKSEEALQAFKRGKELERQAAAVEIALRKSRRKASTLNSSTSSEETTEESQELRQKNKPVTQRGKGEKDDLAAELRELGWSDADLQDGEKKPGKASLEGELSNLLGEISRDPARDRKTSNLDKTQVTTLKKRALMLKREGKLAEAKEELKRAKLLEKQIEEQELLAGSEDSDDELSALIRSMDDSNYKHDDSLLDYSHDQGFNKEIFVDFSDGNAFDGVDVTVADMNDPEIAAALKSFGWAEDTVNSDDDIPESVPKNVDALRQEVLILKREAVNLKRSGNVTEAMTRLKKAKLIEKEIEDLQSQGHSNALETLSTNSKQKPSTSFTTEVISVSMEDYSQRPPPKSKLAIQKELLSLKKKALALRREGRLEDAEEELKKGSVLERQLQEMENAPGVVTARSNISRKDIEPSLGHKHLHAAESLSLEDKEDPDVSEKDMNDPTLLSVLKNLGWEDEDNESGSLLNKATKPTNRDSASKTTMISTSMEDHNQRPPIKSRLAIQRELLGLKKKALALRREGRLEEAEEELKKGKVLERQLEEMENAPGVVPVGSNASKKDVESAPAHKHPDAARSLTFEEEEPDVTEKDMNDPALLSVLKNLGWEDEGNESGSSSRKALNLTGGETSKAEAPGRARRSKAEIQRELLGFKRKALGLRRQGKSEAAEEELTKAKALEEQLAEMEAQEKELLHGSKSKESENPGSLVLEKHGRGVEHGTGLPSYSKWLSFNSADDPVGKVSDSDTKDSQLPKALEDLDWKKNDRSMPCNDKHPLIAKAGPATEAGQTKQMGVPPQPNEVANPTDLLTGEQSSNLLPTGKLFSDGNSDASTPFSGLQHHPEVSASLAEKTDTNGILSGLVPNHVAQMGDNTVTAEIASAGTRSDRTSLQQEVLAHKKNALALKREGKLSEAREELRQAKLLEKSLEENQNQSDIGHASATVSSFERIPAVRENKTNHASKPLSGRDRFKMQQESLAHKRQALKLRREGRISESEAEFELAKALETQLEELGGHASDNYKSKGEATDDVLVDDLLDPQLLSSLKAIGWQEADMVGVGQVPKKSEFKPAIIEGKNTAQEKGQLEERIKAEKVRALNLKREGKQTEALDALRQAKLLEKKLNSLASQ
ncbi:hypothetical protein ACLOJK_020437 [Asimina triloba]